MDKTELNQISNTLNTAIQKLEKLLSSLTVLSSRNTHIDVSDIMMLAQILSIQSSISKIGNINSALNNFLDECANVFSHQSRLNLPATLTDDAIYTLYSLVERSPHIRTNFDSEIVAAIIRIYSLRRYRANKEFLNSLKSWGHSSLSGRRIVAKIEFHDGTILPNRQFAIPKNLPEFPLRFLHFGGRPLRGQNFLNSRGKQMLSLKCFREQGMLRFALESFNFRRCHASFKQM